MFNRPTLSAFVVSGLFFAFCPMIGAQSTGKVAQVPAPACPPVLSVISIRLIDTAGHPIKDGTVDMTRLRDGKNLGRAAEMGGGSGEFQVLESTALPMMSPKGERIRLVARANGKRASAVIKVGRDLSGCRLTRLSGPEVLALK